MRFRFIPRPRWLIHAIALVFLGIGSAAAQTPQAAAAGTTPRTRPESLFSADYLRLLWDDTRYTLTEPMRWTGDDWSMAALVTAGTAASSSLDHTVRRHMDWNGRDTGSGRFFQQWEKLGMQYSWIELGAFEVWGVLGDSPAARDTAMDGVAASIIAGGIVTPILKYSIGRYRPSETDRTFKFRPFSGHQSLPSGHATQAFAIATVIAYHYPEWWQQSLAYGSATLVAVARVQQNQHYVSDVVAGAAIGWSVARAVVHHNGPPRAFGFQVQPWFAQDARGLLFTRQF